MYNAAGKRVMPIKYSNRVHIFSRQDSDGLDIAKVTVSALLIAIGVSGVFNIINLEIWEKTKGS